MFTPPVEVSAVLAAFAPLFTEPSWCRAQALLCGVLLAPANHTLTAALRALGLAGSARLPELPSVAQSGALVGPAGRPGAAQVIGGGLCALGAGDHRSGRHHRTAPRAQAHGPGHLLRCGPLQQSLFSENQRLTLDDGGRVGARRLGGPGL